MIYTDILSTRRRLLTFCTGNPLRRQLGSSKFPTVICSFQRVLASALSNTTPPNQWGKSMLYPKPTLSNARAMRSPYLHSSLIQPHLRICWLTSVPSDDKDSSSSSIPTKDLTASSAASAKDQSMTLIGTAPLGTGIPSAPETTQAIVITDVYV